jgi:hypothetical protein
MFSYWNDFVECCVKGEKVVPCVKNENKSATHQPVVYFQRWKEHFVVVIARKNISVLHSIFAQIKNETEYILHRNQLSAAAHKFCKQ